MRSSMLFASANAAVYIVGAAFEKLDGKLTAGAKTWTVVAPGRIGSGLAPHECGDPCSTPGAVGTCMDCMVGSASCADKYAAKCL